MKIGTCVHLNDINEMSKKFDELLANGFDSCQLISWKPELWTDENAEILKKLIGDKKITVNLGVNLDTANVILYGRANPVDALDVFGKYVRNLHAKDGCYPTNGHDLGMETRIGEGKVDFNRLFEKLHEIGYDSYVTIEREIEGEEQNKDILYAKEYLENIIEMVYGEAK